MKKFGFYKRGDKAEEMLSKTIASSRLNAARFFASQKRLTLKQFLSIYTVSK